MFIDLKLKAKTEFRNAWEKQLYTQYYRTVQGCQKQLCIGWAEGKGGGTGRGGNGRLPLSPPTPFTSMKRNGGSQQYNNIVIKN